MRLIFAYLDPGSISMVFQGAVAALIAIPVIFRGKIRAMFRRGSSTTPAEAHETVIEPTTTTDTTTR
ncbi:MAG: hypothetical protein U0869_26065 [Chloroflexota bacterium]